VAKIRDTLTLENHCFMIGKRWFSQKALLAESYRKPAAFGIKTDKKYKKT